MIFVQRLNLENPPQLLPCLISRSLISRPMPIARLDRTIFHLSGDGAAAWLERLTTNTLSAPLSFAALLTPQGKIIADFFIQYDGADLLLDVSEKYAQSLYKRLKMYRLRAPITISETALNSYAIWGGTGDEGYLDPRDHRLGYRLITESVLDSQGDYNAHRLSLAIPDSHYDFDSMAIFPANANMDRLNGVNFKKGCFIGQEVVSRMERKTTITKRMHAIRLIDPQIRIDPDIKPEDDITQNGRIIGQILHVHQDLAMAMIREDRLDTSAEKPTIKGMGFEFVNKPN